jgi:hypothetical protein
MVGDKREERRNQASTTGYIDKGLESRPDRVTFQTAKRKIDSRVKVSRRIRRPELEVQVLIDERWPPLRRDL